MKMKKKYNYKNIEINKGRILHSKKSFKYLKSKPERRGLCTKLLIKCNLIFFFLLIYFIFKIIKDKIKKVINKNDYLIENQLAKNYVNNSFIIYHMFVKVVVYYLIIINYYLVHLV